MYTKEESDSNIPRYKDIDVANDQDVSNYENGAAALPMRHLISRPDYELPNLDMLSIMDGGKVKNTESSNPHEKASHCSPMVRLGDQQDGFDDGIPKLPDLGWASDQGEIDPMGRLSKAESAVFDASQQDLMSDL